MGNAELPTPPCSPHHRQLVVWLGSDTGHRKPPRPRRRRAATTTVAQDPTGRPDPAGDQDAEDHSQRPEKHCPKCYLVKERLPAVLLASHGSSPFHRNPELAVLIGGIVEEAAQAELAAEHLGRPVLIDPDMRAAALRRAMVFGTAGGSRASST